MTVKRFGIAVWLLVCGFCFWVPQSVHARVVAESNLSFSNLQIIPTDPAGTVVLTPWGLEAFAEARNSLGELDQDYASSTSPDQVQANAAVTWANAHGDASALTNPPDLNVTANANSIVNIPDHIKNAWAASDGRGSLSNLFTITGGAGSVDVDFSVDIAGNLHVLTGLDHRLGHVPPTDTELWAVPTLQKLENQQLGLVGWALPTKWWPKR